MSFNAACLRIYCWAPASGAAFVAFFWACFGPFPRLWVGVPCAVALYVGLRQLQPAVVVLREEFRGGEDRPQDQREHQAGHQRAPESHPQQIVVFWAWPVAGEAAARGAYDYDAGEDGEADKGEVPQNILRFQPPRRLAVRRLGGHRPSGGIQA